MNAWVLPLVLQVLAVFIIAAEVVLPSMGLLTLLALGLVGYSLYLVFSSFTPSVFYWVLGADLLALPLVFVLGFKMLAASPLSLKKELSADAGVVSQSPELEKYLNHTGRTLTTLRPSGMALIDGIRLDVITDGEFIEAEAPVTVCKVAGNQVFVSRLENK